MRLRSRSMLLTGGLVAALLLVAYVSTRDEGRAPTTPPASNRSSRTSAPQDDVPVVDVKLELLKDPHRQLAEGKRNPFRFQPKPAPPAPTETARGRPTAPITPPVPTGPPPPPPIPLRFIGLMDAPTQGGRVAILSDGRGNVFYGKEGDIIEGRYKVLRIGADVAELAYSDGRGRQTIRLSGQ